MLTADLVHTRRRGDRLIVVPLPDEDRPRALELAGFYLEQARLHQDRTRGEFLEACQAVELQSKEARLAKGLMKLVMDACVFEEETPLDAAALRADLFTRATSARRSTSTTPGFDRDRLLAECADPHGISPEALLSALYADLPEAHRLRQVYLPSAERLLATYDLAQYQATLLRATSLVAKVSASSPDRYRRLFRTLKFHRLLYAIAPLPKGRGYTIALDGPMSLFEQTTKYGLKLALALPAIQACGAWSIEADLRWGKDRRSLRFQLSGDGDGQLDEPTLPDDLATLLGDLQRLDSPWRVEATSALLEAKGVGLCVPDLCFTHKETGDMVYLELLGFWSRDAVWKRIDLAKSGLPHKVIFAVAKHLRVGEEALPDDTGATLYVYPRTPNARAILDRVTQLAPPSPRPSPKGRGGLG